MRFILTALLGVAFLGSAIAGDETAKARAALALQIPVMDEVFEIRARDALGCGHCRTDLDACKVEALAKGKPIVLFVGGCDARGQVVSNLGAIPVRAAKYDRDEPDTPSRKRMVVMTPKGGKLQLDTLPADASTEAIRDLLNPRPTPTASPSTSPPSSLAMPCYGSCSGGSCGSCAGGTCGSSGGRRR